MQSRRPTCLLLAALRCAPSGLAQAVSRGAQVAGAAVKFVAGGMFRRSRNPLYLRLPMRLVASTIRLGSWPGRLGPARCAADVTRFQILPEERVLPAKFGTTCHDYLQRSRRWL